MGRKLSWALLSMKEEADAILIWTLLMKLPLPPMKFSRLNYYFAEWTASAKCRTQDTGCRTQDGENNI